MGQWGKVVVLNEVLVHFVCNIFVCTCSVVGGGCDIHVSKDERGTYTLRLHLCLHLKAGGLCFRAMHLLTQTVVPPFLFVEVHHL